jgi:methionyl aminopeptidase
MKINYYSSDDFKKIKEGGKITAMVIKRVLEKAVPGINTMDLEKYARELIKNAGGYPSFMMEKDYHFATCMNVNDMVVHGVPSEYKLQVNDVLGVDVGVYYGGFHTDASWTTQIQNSKLKIQNSFLLAGELALEEAIKVCRVGNHIGDISAKIQEIIEGHGYSCVKQLVGHGVGKELHEDPEIPCFIRGKVENTAEIKAGMCLAIEVIYNEGKSPIVYANDDGWTIVTRDGHNSGLFEHTVFVTPGGPEVITAS